MRKVLMLGAGLVFLASANAQTTNYTLSNIVTSAQDPRMLNAWGLSRPFNAKLTENEWWINDQLTGLSTLYDANGTIVKLAVTIPPASGAGTGSPTGTAFNPVNNSFAFVTLDGTLSVWNSATKPVTAGTHCAACHVTAATIVVNHGSSGASYQGITLNKNASSGALDYYVANANGGVEVYNAQTFSQVSLAAGAFTDATIPASYTPAGIQAFETFIIVTYNAQAGGGTGYVDFFDTNGKLLLRLQQGFFNQPWGVAVTPSNFGQYSGMILVGNTGSGLIGAYKGNGTFAGFVESNGENLVIPGLWGLEFGNGNTESGPANVLYFTAGGVSQTTGVFGAITAE